MSNAIRANEKFGETIAAVLCIVLSSISHAQSGGKGPSHSAHESSQAKVGTQLPSALASVIAKVKTQTHIAILLPSKLPRPFSEAKYPIVETASENKYAISLYYELHIGEAGYAVGFSADAHPDYGPQELPNVSEVKLSRGLVGYFRPVSCGGSCAPANLWWKDNQILYSIQLKLPPTLSERLQQKTILAAANSAILSGPR